MKRTARVADAGITLVEMLVALALFSLVGLAGFTMLDAVLNVQDRTDGRLERLAAIDRTLMVFSRDLSQADPMSVTLTPEVLEAVAGETRRGYRIDEGIVIRETENIEDGEPALQQVLLENVAGLSFRILSTGQQWFEIWPAEDVPPQVRAVEMILTLEGGDTVLRLAELPGVPPS